MRVESGIKDMIRPVYDNRSDTIQIHGIHFSWKKPEKKMFMKYKYFSLFVKVHIHTYS